MNEKFLNKIYKCKSLEHDIDRFSSEIDILQTKLKKSKEELKVKQSHVDPHVTINHQKYSSGIRYMGRFRLYLNQNDKPKLVTISIGNIKEFNGDEDPRIQEIATEKARNYNLTHYPELFK